MRHIEYIAKTKRLQALFRVLDTAAERGLPLPKAVDVARSEIRAYVRSQRQRARHKRGENRDGLADFYTRKADELVRMSARIRRLQLEFASWRNQ